MCTCIYTLSALPVTFECSFAIFVEEIANAASDAAPIEDPDDEAPIEIPADEAPIGDLAISEKIVQAKQRQTELKAACWDALV